MSSRLALLIAAALVVAFMVRASSGHAEPKRRVAVLELTIEGDAEPKLRTQLRTSLNGGLGSAGWNVVPQQGVAAVLKERPELAGCYTSACLGALAEKLGADRFVRARILAEGASYTIVLELLSATSTSGPVGRLERTCAPCTQNEVNDVVSRGAAELREGVGSQVLVRIESSPPGGKVTVDGQAAGTAPLEVPLAPGAHAVVVELDGHEPATQTLEVKDGAPPAAAVFTLAPRDAAATPRPDVTTPEPAPAERGGRRFGAWTWVAAGAGVALVATGIWLWTLDGDGQRCPPQGMCAEAYETTGGSVGLIGLGLAAGGAATWMWFQDRKADREIGVGAAPLPGGGVAVSVSGHF